MDKFEERIEVKSYKVIRHCLKRDNTCICEGEMHWAPLNDCSGVTLYRHLCNECGNEEFYLDCYPKMEYEEVYEHPYFLRRSIADRDDGITKECGKAVFKVRKSTPIELTLNEQKLFEVIKGGSYSPRALEELLPVNLSAKEVRVGIQSLFMKGCIIVNDESKLEVY